MEAADADEKILTMHPEGKQGVRILKSRYDMMKAAICNELHDKGELTLAELKIAVDNRLRGSFYGRIGWYLMAVKLDLEARKMIERVPNSSPQILRIVP